MPQMKVLISGAGIAGNSLAFWLAKLSFCDVTVVEHFSHLRFTGLQVDLRGAGVDVLKRMGLEQAFREQSAPETGFRIVDKKGRERAFLPANKSGGGPQSFTSEYEIMRGSLCRLLYDATPKDRTKYRFGISIDGFEHKDDGSVNVSFTDGTCDIFDLVVGADGVGSRVRKLMIAPKGNILETDPTFKPIGRQYAAYFVIPRPIKQGEDYAASVYVASQHRIVMIRRHSPEEMQALLMWDDRLGQMKDTDRGNTQNEKLTIDRIFRGAGWQTDNFLDSMSETDNFYCQRMGVVKTESWSTGHVALLGDAGYCPSVNGFGTSAAMVGAYIMAGEIGRHCRRPEGDADVSRLAEALQAYEQVLRPFMDGMIKKEEEKKNVLPASDVGISIFNSLVSVAAFLRLHLLVMKLFHPEKGLELPDYEDVLKL